MDQEHADYDDRTCPVATSGFMEWVWAFWTAYFIFGCIAAGLYL